MNHGRRVRPLRSPVMGGYQYYEFLAVDRPLTAAEQDEVGQFSAGAKVTDTGFVSEYHTGGFHADPGHLMRRYYDVHVYLTSWGTRRLMLRLPRAVLDPGLARRYCVDDQVAVLAAGEHVLVDLTSEDESGEVSAEDVINELAGLRAELAAGDLRPLYLAWLAAYGTWERDEDAFEPDDENEVEPPVPPGLGSLTGAQRALAGLLRLDAHLLEVAAEASPAAGGAEESLAAGIAGLPAGEKDRLLLLVARGRGEQVRLELLGGARDITSQRTVAHLLDAAALARQRGISR
jgi:hypothetical protein